MTVETPESFDQVAPRSPEVRCVCGSALRVRVNGTLRTLMRAFHVWGPRARIRVVVVGVSMDLLDGCRNSVLIEMFDRLWMASELSRRWSVGATPGREIEKVHKNPEEAALSRDADQAVRILLRHLDSTAAALR
ncbi:FCD domain-containing protein [Rhodococcus globerulus]|uniref:FCD domain-containing protein n=1 Tax=Rhodococcus globerulus TaxID=33008 RepID=A0ABU4C5D2_RHOGO|nr:FCD domain-containing protein [Rhodococcus globerulus]MDV6271563.1 FCD domain-containing protein [Rhodococcus globerulus]